MGSRKEIDWPEIWRQVAETLEKNGAPMQVRKDLEATEWKVEEDRFIFYCSKALYQWLEVPASENMESNLKYIKPILWPVMQRLGCRTMIYKLI